MEKRVKKEKVEKGQKRRETKAKRKNRIRYSKLAPNTKTDGSQKIPKHEEIKANDLTKYTLEQKIEALNSTSNLIMQTPEKSLSLLKDLFVLLEDDNSELVNRALKKICDIFLDIMPSYKIRIHKSEESDEKVKLSKEVQELRDFETSLLENYAKFLRILNEFIKVKSKQIENEKAKESIRKIKEISIDCLCRFLENIPHMNYTQSIMQVIVSKLSNTNITIRERCTKAIKDLLSNLEHSAAILQLKLQTVKSIGKLLKNKSHKLFDRKILTIFQEHKLVITKEEAQTKINPKIEELSTAIKKKKGKGYKKEARDLEKVLLKELKETSAITMDSAQLNKYNSEILREILAIFISILKDQPTSPLLVSVFEGLPYFAPFIDIEICADCLAVIKSYMKTALIENKNRDFINLSASLLCAIKISHSIGTTFDVDESAFLSYAFKMLDFIYEKSPKENLPEKEIFEALIKSLNMLFIEKKQLSNDVIAAFIKKIAIICMNCTNNEQSKKMLIFLREILKKYPKMRGLLDVDEGAVDPNVFRENLIDPQFCVTASNISINKELIKIKENQGQKDKEIIFLIKEIFVNKY